VNLLPLQQQQQQQDLILIKGNRGEVKFVCFVKLAAYNWLLLRWIEVDKEGQEEGEGVNSRFIES
jgi:hypothetical protein